MNHNYSVFLCRNGTKMDFFWPVPVWGAIYRAYYSYSFFFNLLIRRFEHFRGQALQPGIDLVFTVPHIH